MSDINGHGFTAHGPPPEAAFTDGTVTFPVTGQTRVLIEKAAELQGWTVAEYLLAAVLDRAERDIYTDAALRHDWGDVYPTSAEPFTTYFDVLSDRD